MTRIRLDQLPAAVRAKVMAQIGHEAKRRPSRAGVGNSAPCPGYCACGRWFQTAAMWERHVDREHGGNGIWSIDLKAAT